MQRCDTAVLCRSPKAKAVWGLVLRASEESRCAFSEYVPPSLLCTPPTMVIWGPINRQGVHPRHTPPGAWTQKVWDPDSDSLLPLPMTLSKAT